METPRKGGIDYLLSRVTSLFLTVVTLAFSKFVLNDPILSTYALRVNKARKKEVDRRIASGRASS